MNERLETIRAQVSGLKRESIYQRQAAAFRANPYTSKLAQDPVFIAQEMAYDKVLHLFNLGDVPEQPVLSISDQADIAATSAVRDYQEGLAPKLVRHLQTRNKQPKAQWNDWITQWNEWITFELNECPELPDDSLNNIWHELQSGWDKLTFKNDNETVQYRLPRH